mmetsp:Transcript_7501/g.21811  ORF Transcript_7501/g.21811 Transcript_7501/m.21811 type:complete len:209 (-) Transcript_7501:674-1300(-)
MEGRQAGKTLARHGDSSRLLRRQLHAVEAAAVVRLLEVLDGVRAHRDDGVRVEDRVAREVVHLDVLHVDGLADLRDLVELAAVVHDVRVLADGLAVGLEVDDVDLVEAHERHEEADVRLGELVAGDVALARQDVFDAVQGAEELCEGRLVGVLGRGEAAAVYAVVDGRVDPLVHGVDLRAQVLRVQVQLRVLAQTVLVEGAVKHADDL